MSKQEFLANAKPIILTVNGIPLTANPKKFSTGSVGYQATGKAPIQLPDGSVAKLQIGSNLTLIGSKDWPETTTAAA